MINDTDSQNTFYVLDKKNDIPIVFIHGVGLNHKIWAPQINVFENTFLAYDILGHGKTPLSKENISFDDFSNQLTNLIDELNMKKIHLVGFSIGALIAQHFTQKYYTKVNKLVLIGSVYKRTKEQIFFRESV